MKIPEPVQIIFFDAVGTVFHLTEPAYVTYSRIGRMYGFNAPMENWQSTFEHTWNTMPPEPTTRRRRPDGGRMWWLQFVTKVMQELFPTDNPGHHELQFQSFFETLFTEFVRPGCWTLYPETHEVLSTLAAKYRVGMITNFDDRIFLVLHALGIEHLFEFVMTSAEAGADKPDPWIYRMALARATVAPIRAIHVGDDSIADWGAAASAGLHTFELDRSRNSLRELIAS